ncbi:4a-hydroxytetrahydrobiopterin dehydratase [Candidatus Pacearchaeota archaeon]|nr:4a-hydroxytetrahydrobiopterin dehydratase [Candidatus Pacearchaeota archaeon]
MLTLEDIKEKMGKLQNWALDGTMIVKDSMFPDFKAAMEFVNKVAEIAEKHNHHPAIVIDYNHVHLSLITHETNSLSEKDFKVAEDIDKIG